MRWARSCACKSFKRKTLQKPVPRERGQSQYLVRVPVRIEDDDGVGALQIQTQTAGTRRQQKQKVIAVLRVELLQQVAAILRFGGAVETQIPETPPGQVVLHDGHQLGHLTEEQDAMSRRLELGQDAIQQFEFTGGAVQVGAANQQTNQFQKI
jgi:hypothetical protein